MREIVGGVVSIVHDIVAKIKIINFFPRVFVGDSEKIPAIWYVVHVRSIERLNSFLSSNDC